MNKQRRDQNPNPNSYLTVFYRLHIQDPDRRLFGRSPGRIAHPEPSSTSRSGLNLWFHQILMQFSV